MHPAIRITNLCKSYSIAHRADRPTSLAEALTRRLRAPLRRDATTETFWALQDVDLEIAEGQVVGIIGRNGAGKSTLLKILSRITEPTAGRIELFGRIGSLLEVGTGFHPELSGRENIYLNGAILGMSRSEIRRQFDAIVDFSGVEKFLDTPVKRYSSGMYVRLAFAVAAHLEPEILIVDEVLAVGDAEFQRRCIGKMRDVAGHGRTVLFVSHNMAAIRSLCTSAVLLTSGKIDVSGEPDTVIEAYERIGQARATGIDLASRVDRCGSGEVRAVALRVIPEDEAAGVTAFRPVRFEIDYVAREAVSGLTASVDINAADGYRIATLYGAFVNQQFDVQAGRGTLTCRVRSLPLRPDRYMLGVWLGNGNGAADFVEDAGQLDVLVDDIFGTGRIPDKAHGSTLVPYEWSDR